MWKTAAEFEDLKYETSEDGIAKITINRPEVRNAFRPKTVSELLAALELAHQDSGVGVVILTGEGDKAFCSGGDQKVRGEAGYVGDDGVPRLATHGWQQQQMTSLWELLAIYTHSGIRHVLCTDIGRDGAMSGPNVGLYAECCRRFPDVLFQASGGVRRLADLRELAATGVAGAISGRALLEGELAIEEARPFLPNA